MKEVSKSVKKVELETSYSSKQRTERLEIRCSKNFNTLVNAVIGLSTYSKPSKADVLHRAMVCLAEKEGLLRAGDSRYI